MTPFQAVTEACGRVCGPVKRQSGWMRCAHPCHPEGDAARSFAYMEQPDGTVMVASHKPSYSTSDCLKALGLDWKDLFPDADPRKLPKWQGKHVVRRYEYTDERGNLVGGVSRTEDKDFPQGHYEGSRYVAGLNGKPLPLYLAPLVRQWAAEGRTIYVTEGEKDARALAAAGEAATTKPGGAKAPWLPVHTDALKGCAIIVVADKDEAGEMAARLAWAALSPSAQSFAVVEAKEGKDAHDHIEKGFAVSELVPRPDLCGPVRRRRTLADFGAEDAEFLWEPYLRDCQVNILDAKGGSGKTTFIIGMSACASHGRTPFGEPCEPYRTLYYGNEDSEGEIRATFEEIGGDATMVTPVSDVFQLDGKGWELVEADLQEVRPRLVVFDPIKAYLSGGAKGEYDPQVVYALYGKARALARSYRCCFLFIRHFSKFAKDKELTEKGGGLAQWYDLSRSQLILMGHPKKARNAVVFHGRGSLRGGTGEPFGFGFSECGTFGFVKDPDVSCFDFVQDASKPGPRSTVMPRCIEWLGSRIDDSGASLAELARDGKFPKTTLHRALEKGPFVLRDTMGVERWYRDPYAD